jgi:hypothetical protein
MLIASLRLYYLQNPRKPDEGRCQTRHSKAALVRPRNFKDPYRNATDLQTPGHRPPRLLPKSAGTRFPARRSKPVFSPAIGAVRVDRLVKLATIEIEIAALGSAAKKQECCGRPAAE